MGMPEYLPSISQETRLFLWSCLLGLPLGMLFDSLRLLRALLPHHRAAVFFEDLLLSLSACVLLQLYATVFAHDALRWYYALGAMLGLALWLLTFSAVWTRMLRLLRRFLHAIGNALRRTAQKSMRFFVRIAKSHESAKKIDETP